MVPQKPSGFHRGRSVQGVTVNARSENPFPGPRPLTALDAKTGRLVGRDEDIEELMFHLCGQKRLVGLSAGSGDGKTSFLHAGLIPALQTAGYSVAYFDRWQKLSDNDGTSHFIQALREATFHPAQREVAPSSARRESTVDTQSQWENLRLFKRPSEVTSFLHNEFKDRFILILDQFEELFRVDQDLGRKFVDEINTVLSARPTVPIRILLSLRREFKAELGSLQRRLHPSIWFDKELEPVAPEFMPALLAIPLQKRGSGAILDQTCASNLTRAWELAAFPSAEGARPTHEAQSAKIGILHFQALLWVIWSELNQKVGGEGLIDWDGLTLGPMQNSTAGRLRVSLENQAASEECLNHFKEVLGTFLVQKLEGFRKRLGVEENSGAEQTPIQRIIALETWGFTAAIAPQLSSGNYKLLLDADELAFQCPLGFDVLEVLGEDEHKCEKRILTHVRSRCVSLEQELGDNQDRSILRQNDPCGDYTRFLTHLRHNPIDQLLIKTIEGKATDDEKKEAVAGGRLKEVEASHARIAIEIAITYARALDWLERSNIIRFTPGAQPREGVRELWVSIIHDHYGEALRTWGHKVQKDPEVSAAQFVALRGQELMLPELEGSGARRLVEGPISFRHAVWQGCILKADLKDVTFVDCDLRGLLMLDCDFDNVAFVNCVTWGLLIQRSRFFGKGMTFRVDDKTNYTTTVNGLSIEDKCVFGPKTQGQTPDKGGFGATSGRFEDDCRTTEPNNVVPLVIQGLNGYGLFLNGVNGAHWRLEDCQLSHINIGGENIVHGSGYLSNCDITLGSINGEYPGSDLTFDKCNFNHVLRNGILLKV